MNGQSRETINRNGLTPGGYKTIIITYPDYGHDRSTSVYNLLRSPCIPVMEWCPAISAGSSNDVDKKSEPSVPIIDEPIEKPETHSRVSDFYCCLLTAI